MAGTNRLSWHVRKACLARSFLALLLLTSLAAVERDDPVEQARKVAAECLRGTERDLWTCLQLDGWAQETDGVRWRLPAPNGWLVHGHPRFAFPHAVRSLWDLGDQVLTWSGNRLYRLTGDGRPICPSLKLGEEVHALGVNLPWLAATEVRRQAHASTLRVEVTDLRTDKTLWQTCIDPSAWGHQVWGWLRDHRIPVAADGSAVAMAGAIPGDRINHPVWAVAARATNGQISQAGFKTALTPLAIGPDASWLIARNDQQWRQILLRPAAIGTSLVKVTAETVVTNDLRDWATGSGWAAVTLDEERLALVSPTGALTTWKPAPGRVTQVETFGSYLVLGLAGGGQGPEIKDILGTVLQPAGPLPERILVFRWRDLAAQAGPADPILALQAPFRQAHHPAGLLRWQQDELRIIDCTGEVPNERRLLRCDQPIRDAWPAGFHYCVRFTDQQYAMITADGGLLWQGQATEVQVPNQSHLLLRQAGDTPWQLVHLDETPIRTTTLELTGAWNVQVAVNGQRVVANRQGGPDQPGAWRLLSGQDGRQLDAQTINDLTPNERQQPPSLGPGEVEVERGRFLRRGGRLLPKSVLQVNDRHALLPVAAYVPASTNRCLIIDTIGSTFSSDGRKLSLLGQRPGARKVVQVGAFLGVAGDGDRLLGIVASNTMRDIRPTEIITGLDDGRWQLRGPTLCVPGSGAPRRWNQAAIGFVPAGGMLQGTPGYLLVVTPSLVLQLTPAAVTAATELER